MNAETASLFDEPGLDELVDDLDDAEVIDGPEPVKAGERRKKSKTSPTQRTLKYLRRQGCELVAVTEKWNPYMNGGRGGRQDLFGIIDVLALKDGHVIAVQATASGVSERITKMVEATFKNPETETECLVLPALFKANIRVYVHGWRRDAKGKWTLREVELS
jgi:hypothetical protein